MKRSSKITALLLAAALLLAGCGGKAGDSGESGEANKKAGKEASADATTMRLEKTVGEVAVWDEEEENVELQEKLPLYSGYQLFTRAESFSWINLDDTKLAKMDKESAASIQKEGKHLTLTASQGSLFFNVTEPLAEDETMEIEFGDMIVGIRGTCGWVSAAAPRAVYILEGTVTCEIPDENLSAQVSAGEMAYLVKSTEDRIQVEPFTRMDIPRFVLDELDSELVQSIPESEPETESLPPETEAADTGVYTLPMSSADFEELMRNSQSDQTITIRAGAGDNTLSVDGFTSISGHLILEEGVNLSISEDAQLNIYGTLDVRSDLSNDGFLWILDGASLQVGGAFANSGMLSNGEIEKGMDETPVETQNCRIVAAQGIENTGYLENAGSIEGSITVNGGNISLMAGNVDRLVLNDGLYIDDGGAVGEFTQNGGKTTSAEQGYRY
ncbi:MAG: hypothetical protein HFI65_01280 [Lachnospiraceae bacterium]|nr:hypothetical protein [Lachnospiraceae bacterium]